MNRMEKGAPLGRLKDERGFTLVELLVVIGILIVLGAITFPVVQNALAKSREAAGLQNMRQIADALVAYVSDNKAYPPSATKIGSGATEVRQRWFNTLSPYLGIKDPRAMSNAQGKTGGSNGAGDANQEIFNQVMIDPLVRGDWEIGRNNSIGYNHQYLGNARGATAGTGKKKNGRVNFPVFDSEIARKDMTIAFAYTDGTGYVEPYRGPATQFGPESTSVPGADFDAAAGLAAEPIDAATEPTSNRLTTLGNEGYQIDPTFLPVVQLDADAPLDVVGAAGGSKRHNQAARGVVTNRYNGGTIVAFADGHVDYLKREAVYLDPRSGAPSNRLWNGFGRDNDEDGDGIFEPASETAIDSNEWVVPSTPAIPSLITVVGAGNPGAIGDVCPDPIPAGMTCSAAVPAVDTPVINAAIECKMNTDAATACAGGIDISGNSSLLQGAPAMLVKADPIVRGGVATDVDSFLGDANGPTTPKRRPFPIAITVLGQTLVNK